MDQKQKGNSFANYIVAIAVMFALFWGLALVGSIGELIAPVPETEENIVTDFLLVIVSLIAMIVYWLIYRKRKFRGLFTFEKCKKEVYIGYFVAIGVDIICVIIAGVFSEGGIKSLVTPSISTLALSLAAGVYEETVFRGIPISIFMKDKPGSLRIYLAVLITSVGFASVHLMNVDMGATLQVTIIQVVSCFITGVFLAAIYLRTGSVLYIMFYHFFHDFINVMLPEQSTGIMLQATFTVSDYAVEIALAITELIVGIWLLCKVNHEDIRNRWSCIWNENN